MNFELEAISHSKMAKNTFKPTRSRANHPMVTIFGKN